MSQASESVAPTEVQAVLFDVGGVLVELGGLEVFRGWSGSAMSDDEIWKLWLGSPAVRAFERGQIEAAAFARELVDELNLPVSRAHFLDAFTAWPKGLLPGVEDLLGRLRSGLERATLSNTNALHWPRTMEEMGLGPLFDWHFPSHETGRIKPDADAFHHVADALGLAPAEILFLDDTRINVAAARAAGFQAEQALGVEAAEQVLDARGLLAGEAAQAGSQGGVQP